MGIDPTAASCNVTQQHRLMWKEQQVPRVCMGLTMVIPTVCLSLLYSCPSLHSVESICGRRAESGTKAKRPRQNLKDLKEHFSLMQWANRRKNPWQMTQCLIDCQRLKDHHLCLQQTQSFYITYTSLKRDEKCQGWNLYSSKKDHFIVYTSYEDAAVNASYI